MMPEAVEGVDNANVTIPADAPGFDREALESRVSEKMASVFADSDDNAVDVAEADAAETPAGEKKPADKKPEAVEKPGEEKTDEQQTAEEEAAAKAGQGAAKPPTPGEANPAAPVIPAAYRRSLKAYEWTDEEIDAAAKADPAGFLKAAAKLHATRNEETRRMSDLGRQLKEQQRAAQTQATAATGAKPKSFAKLDIAALKKQYGDEPFIAQLEGINGLVDFANEVMPWMQQSQQRQQQAELESLGRQIDGYFGSKDMTPYHEMYGKPEAKLTEVQLQARQKVLDTADLLIGGARQMGRNLTLEEALTLAHDSVSGPVKEQAARASIAKQIKTRSQAVSLRPGSRAAALPAQGDRKALQATVKAGLAKAFGS